MSGIGQSAVRPLDDNEFAPLLDMLGPFGPQPWLAVAVSGGADSMALVLLAQRWAAARDGRVLALTVDHGLRAESAAEAKQVGVWLAARGIAHEVISWTGLKPSSAIQEKARTARYGLLLGRCRDLGILHLLTAHHRDDQAETVLMRLASGSGLDGLTGMVAVTPTADAALLRPLLDVPRDRLAATLVAERQDWIDDPSNRNEAFLRVRLRRAMPALAAAGLDSESLAASAGKAAALRASLDMATAAQLARAAAIAPAGYARVDVDALLKVPEPIGKRALERVLVTVGGSGHPRSDRLDRLWSEMRTGLALRRTLGGCLIVPGKQTWLVLREPAAMAAPIPCQPGRPAHWDGRFLVRVGGTGEGRVGALGRSGWSAIRHEVAATDIPNLAIPTLPALLDRRGKPLAVPHLGWRLDPSSGAFITGLLFAPAHPVSGGLVWHGDGIMC